MPVILFTGSLMSFPVWLLGTRFLSGVSLSLVPCSFLGVPVWRVSVQGGLCPRGLCHTGSVRGSLSRGSVWGSLSAVRETPPRTKTFLYGKERAVRSLLECFLVTFCDKFKILFTPPVYHAVTITISFKNGL